MNTYNEFCDSIEKDAIWLDDDFFIHLTPEILDKVSECQRENEPEAFKTKWKKHIGEVVFLYDNRYGNINYCLSVGLEELPYYDKEDDIRLVERKSLTRTAARKYAQYLYNGNAQIDEISDEGAVAMMLYIRNGFGKRDFWKAFRFELANGLEELLSGNGPLKIEEVICHETYKDEDKFVVDFVNIAEEMSNNYIDEAFHFVDDELTGIILKAGELDYIKEEIKNAAGQYVIVYSEKYGMDDPLGYMSRDELRKKEEGLMIESMGYIPGLSADSFFDSFDYNGCETEDYIVFFAAAIALFKKNGKTSDDFWKSFCNELLKLLKRQIGDGS